MKNQTQRLLIEQIDRKLEADKANIQPLINFAKS